MNAPRERATPETARFVWPTVMVMVVAAALRVWAAVWDQGLVWPDEIFQTLEQAHRFAFGKGIIPWEFRDGARSWVFPGLLGYLFKAAAAVGVTKALTLVCIAKLSVALLSISGVWAGIRLGRLLGGPRAGLLAGVLGALCPLLVIFGSRCSTESASAPLVLWSALLLEETPSRRRELLAGALVSIAVLFRYQNGIVAMGLLFILLFRARWKGLACYLATAGVVAAIGAYVDVRTWGDPFHPLIAYVKFNSSNEAADRFGSAPAAFFSDHLTLTLGIVAYAVIVLGLLASAVRARGLVLTILAFVAAHVKVPHKELRFLVPVAPLAVALAAVGLVLLMDGLRQGARPTYRLTFALGLLFVLGLRAPTLGDLGYGGGYAPEVVWHANEDYYRATLAASLKPDLCGVSYIDNPHAWTGGYTYLHRDVAVFFDTSPHNLAAANYLVAADDAHPPTGWKKVSDHGKYALYHREGTCAPVPKDWNLDAL